MEATNVSELVEQLNEESSKESQMKFTDAVTEATRVVVEEGTFYPDAPMDIECYLTGKERLRGRCTRDISTVFAVGVMVGAALERDVPSGSDREEKWRNGEFTLSELEE